MSTRVKKSVLGGIALAAVTVLALPGTAFADVSGSANIQGGSLTLAPPASVNFGTTVLDGTAHAPTATQALDVTDNTGSAAGWNITLTSTTFTSSAGSLPTGAVSDLNAPTGACDATISCVLADVSGISYPLNVPDAVAAPTAVKIQTAAASSGMLAQTWTHTMQLAIPATARAGAYTSTWTYSVVSGP